MRDRSWAAPGVNEPEATQSSSEKLRCAGTRSEMQVPGDARVPSTAWTRLPSASLASTKGTASSRRRPTEAARRSEEHTSELQSLMRISYAVFCLKKKNL